MSVCCINNSGMHRKVSNCKHELRLVLHSFPFSSSCYFGLARMRFSVNNKKPKQKTSSALIAMIYMLHGKAVAPSYIPIYIHYGYLYATMVHF